MIITLPEGHFEGYIFDCDGTIADTMPLHYTAWCAALKEHNAEFPEALFYELGGTTAERIVAILNERHGHAMPVVETARRKEELFAELIPQILPIEPVVQIVNDLYGTAPMAVASGGVKVVVNRTLEALGLRDKFKAIVCAEDVKNGKPDPEPFLLAAKLIGANPFKCLVFEDSPTGLEAADNAGMKWVHVPSRKS